MNHVKPALLHASRKTAPPRDAMDADLAIMARLEGRPLPTVVELAQMLEVSQTTAFRIITRFKQSGLLKLVDRVRLPADVCHCIADLRTRLTDGGALERLEARLRNDPCVSTAAAVTGRHSYRVTALHRGMAEGNAWFQALLTEDAVIDGALIFCRPIIDRQHYAQALTGGAR
jgi:DNA-binding Lrp family transcriptional regulator